MWHRAAQNNLAGRGFDTPVIQETLPFSFPPEKQECILGVEGRISEYLASSSIK